MSVYYFSINSNLLSTDDELLFFRLLNLENVNLSSLFFNFGEGQYYRPILSLSFYLDKYLWFLEPSFYHLENVLLHLFNGLFVFFIAKRYVSNKELVIPFVASLLFSLHPINTESVNWISGRTDVLASFFVLWGFLFLLKGIEGRYSILYFIAACFLGFLGSLSKEVGVAFYPAAICLVVFRQNSFPLLKKFAYSMVFALLLSGYFLLRYFAFNVDSGVKLILTGTSVSVRAEDGYFEFLLSVLKAIGFYIKKLFLPMPLNFMISEVSEYHIYLGIVILILTVILLFVRSKIVDLYFVAMIFAIPALFPATDKFTWTPYAERYVYTSSAFFSIFLVAILYKLLSGYRSKVNIFFLGVVLFFYLITFERNYTFSSNFLLYEDTARKNTNSLTAQAEYAKQLMKSGYIEKAKKIYDKYGTDNSSFSGDKEMFHINKILHSDYSIEEKKKMLFEYYKESKRLKNFIPITIIKINAEPSNNVDRVTADNENLIWYEELFKNTDNYFYIYKIAQIQLRKGMVDEALANFEKVYKKLGLNNRYGMAAKKSYDRISNNKKID